MIVIAQRRRPLNRSPQYAAALLVSLASVQTAFAAPSKEECVASHGQGQDLREKGQLSAAKKAFLVCAQSSCPALISSDCAKMSDELERLTPTVTFAARDAKGADVSGASVYVDDKLVLNRLDEGKAVEMDPGRHNVRFVFESKEARLTVVIVQGEKSRALVGSFADLNAEAPKVAGGPSAPGGAGPAKGAGGTQDPTEPQGSKSVLPLVFVGVGGAAAVTGLVLLGVGLGGVPSVCSNSSKQCDAKAGDAVFGNAKSSVQLANVGLIVASIGGAVTLGSILWYVLTPKSASSTTGKLLPWTDGRSSAGLTLHSAF
jgi:hypothetical protein